MHDVVTLSRCCTRMVQLREMAGDVETRGELTLGATVFDRRANPRWRPNMDVAVGIEDREGFTRPCCRAWIWLVNRRWISARRCRSSG